ncbi:MAG: primosomal protein N' [Planctomycetes bacterium]|nr:primosomal protein N' [Planctomycetota bacterium]
MGKTPSMTAPGFLWTEEGEPRKGMVAEVAPCIPTHRTYSYAVPDTMASSLAPGQRVRVCLGKRRRSVAGFVVSLDHKEWDSTLKPIEELMDRESYLPADLVELGQRMALHYGCPLGQTLKAMTPEAVRIGRGLKTVRYLRLAKPLEEIRAAGARLSAKRTSLLEALSQARGAVAADEILAQADVSMAVLRGVIAAGWVQVTEKEEITQDVSFDAPREEPTFELTEEQRRALDHINGKIDEAAFSVTMLFGVSGSGKTEIYVRAMRRVLEAGRQVILLVPEIVLTTQLVKRLATRFDDLAVHHSGLTEVQRSILWRQIASGEKRVIIGTRSAVFAPCEKLGLICVDEEQETSYKNLQAPRFHVRDVAIMRAQQWKIPIVLGSATPSLETWYNCEHRSHYHRVIIRRRVKSLPMPKVHVVDMEDERAEQKRAVVFSRMLVKFLGETLERGEQALLLINRRGFAHALYCPSCKTRLSCPRCNVGLVVHTVTGQVACHYCHTKAPIPESCPSAGCGEKLIHTGIGTQRVEDVLAALFPRARVIRADSDTMTHRRHYQALIEDFEARRVDILVGTQMIAKGLDFPQVSLVGVIDADPATLGSDFRAHERLFQLVTQVAGRAGRAEVPGRVVVQTSMPELPALRHALRHDYEAFAVEELAARRKANLPPFRRLARIVLAHPREATVRQEADSLAETVRATIESLGLDFADVLGPNPCALARLRSRYRYELLLRTRTAGDMHKLTDCLNQKNALRAKVDSVMLDVDPVAML